MSNIPYKVGDWLSRQVVPDVYPRKSDPFAPPAAIIPDYVPATSMLSDEQLLIQAENPIVLQLTVPGQRPVVYQRAVNQQITVTGTPIPLMNAAFMCDTMVIDNIFGAANSVFFGYSSAVSVTSGIEIRPGLPVSIEPENTREPWELQRVQEYIAALLALQTGYTPLSPYKAPRVAFNANEYFLVGPAGTTTTVAVMLFYLPEQQ